jgi:tetraacyldisaccharide 4'-kinase
VDIAIVAAADLSARRVPFGPLRESARALARADAVLIDAAASPDLDETRRRVAALTDARVFTLGRRLGRPVAIEADRGSPEAVRRVVAVAGIAAPERFGDALRDAGFDVVRLVAFRDHHAYRAGDLAAIAAAARESGAAWVLTTAKDAVRLLPLRPLRLAIAAVPLEIDIEPRVELEAWLLGRLRERRR